MPSKQPIEPRSELNCRIQSNALIDKSAPHLRASEFLYPERIVVGCLILLMGGGEEVFASFGAAQVEVQGDPLLSIAGGGRCKSLGNDAVTALVASDGDEVLPGGTESGENDRQPNGC